MVENVESKIDHVENSVENVESTRKSAFYFQLCKVETVEMLAVLQFVYGKTCVKRNFCQITVKKHEMRRFLKNSSLEFPSKKEYSKEKENLTESAHPPANPHDPGE